MKTTLFIFAITITSLSSYAQHDHPAKGDNQKNEQSNMVMFKDEKLGKAYEHYLKIKDALVASSRDDAKIGAREILKYLKDVKGADAAIAAATKLVATPTIEEQRNLFSTLSSELVPLLKGEKLAMGMIYMDYCPMANGNTGAFWLSNDKAIKNPYFGDKMLTCGSVKEVIH